MKPPRRHHQANQKARTMNPPPPAIMRHVHAALVRERLDFFSFTILIAIAAEKEPPTQAQVARSLDLRYWAIRNLADCSPWIIKHRLDLIRLSLTDKALAVIRRIKPCLSCHHSTTQKP